MDRPLILSIFPGIGLLDGAFEEEWPEACLVRGPDRLWGGDARRFHPPAGVFDGVLGGPPCTPFTRLRHLNPRAGEKDGNLIPEFERVVAEAQPLWFLMENVPDAPVPQVPGYWPARTLILNNRWLGQAQERTRRFSLGTRHSLDPLTLDVSPDVALFESADYQQAVTRSARSVPVKLVRDGQGGHKLKRTYTADGKRHGPSQGARMAVADMAEAQGLPRDFLADAPLTAAGKRLVIGNGVPIAMGRAIARAIKRALAGAAP